MHWQKLHLTSFKLTRFQVESFPLVLEINVSFSFQMRKYHIAKKKKMQKGSSIKRKKNKSHHSTMTSETVNQAANCQAV